MWTRHFWIRAAERAVKTFAQSGIAMITADGFDWFHVDWRGALGVAAVATVLSVLSSIVSTEVGAPNDPSAVSG